MKHVFQMKLLICGLFLVGCISANLSEVEQVDDENELEAVGAENQMELGGIRRNDSSIEHLFLQVALLLKGDLAEGFILKKLKDNEDSLFKYHYLKKNLDLEPLEAYLLINRFSNFANLKIGGILERRF